MMVEVSSPETADRVLSYLQGNPTASCRAIGDALGVGRQTAHRALTRLLGDGRIVIKRKGTGRDYPTTYAITEEHP